MTGLFQTSSDFMRRGVVILLGVALPSAAVRGADQLPAIFSDHMVIQRDMRTRVWGRSEPGTAVRVAFGDHRVSTAASAAGEWMVELPPLRASAVGRPLVIQAERLHRFDDVLVGDVWLFSGQSNMNWPMAQTQWGEEELVDAELPALRLFQMDRLVADQPEFCGRGRWELSRLATARPFSAIAFLAGRGLLREQGVPVGVIQSTWSGTKIRVWLPWPVLSSTPRFRSIVEDWERELADFPRLKAEFEAKRPELTAEWERAVALARQEGRSPPYPPQLRTGSGTRYQPGGLFAGMIAPLAPYAIKGVAWYQGESDAGQPELYRELLTALIGSWRTAFRDDRLPFVIVQLPNLRRGAEPAGGGWPGLREAQLQVARQVPAVALVTTIDVGNPADVHPTNKQPVAARIQAAFGALTKGVGNPGERLAPVPIANSSNGADGTIIQFDPPGVDLVLAGESPGLVIAGEDRRFVPAHCRIEGETIVVSSPDVPRPRSVRYAWGGNPVAGLFSKAGIPMSPFRLDDWPEDTVVYSQEALASAIRP